MTLCCFSYATVQPQAARSCSATWLRESAAVALATQGCSATNATMVTTDTPSAAGAIAINPELTYFGAAATKTDCASATTRGTALARYKPLQFP